MIVDGIPIEVQKKPIKNIHIHVKAPDGHVLLTAPKRASDKAIEGIIRERIGWIKKQQMQIQARMKIRSDENVNWEVKRKQLCANITYLLPKWEAITGLYCSSWQIRKMKTRWGSCNTKTKKIWFNLHLAQMTTRCLEYIILHELIHIRIANHGSEFKASMNEYMPNWRKVQKELNQYVLF